MPAEITVAERSGVTSVASQLPPTPPMEQPNSAPIPPCEHHLALGYSLQQLGSLVIPVPLRPYSLWPSFHLHFPPVFPLNPDWIAGGKSLLSPPARFPTSLQLDKLQSESVKEDVNSKEFRCNQCNKVYSTAPAFHMHVRTHMQGCECPMCGKTFSRHWLLQGHLRTHTGEKPFKCPVCAKAFADKSNMRAHYQIHSGVKPFVCRRCGKAFALKSYLSKHEESACVRPSPHPFISPNMFALLSAHH